MKPHVITLERLDGLADNGPEIELQGSMDVLLDCTPLEGVHQSKLRMSIQTAVDLHGYLTEMLRDRLKAQSRR